VRIDVITTGEYPGDGLPKPVSFPDPAEASVELEGVRVIALERLVELKLASGMTAAHRRRDLSDIQDLIRAVKLPEELAESWMPASGSCTVKSGENRRPPIRCRTASSGRRYNPLGGSQVNRISVRPDVCHGKPCIAGTRIMVAQVLDLLQAGKSFQEIIAQYFPDITVADIQACLNFARELVENEDIHIVEPSTAE